MTTDTKLLPCPFCGGPAERLDFGPDDAGYEGGSCITCTQCQASGPVEFGRKETFIANWNDRAKDAEIDSLRAEVETCHHPSPSVPVGADDIAVELEEYANCPGRVLALAGKLRALAQPPVAPVGVAGDAVAMQPVAEIAMSDDGYKIGLLGPLRAHRLPLGTKLYASPEAARAAHPSPSVPVRVGGLPRYGFPDGNEPRPVPCADGYWTPWHLAQQPAAFDFAAHLHRQREWSETTFGPGARTAGLIDHIRKELLEIEAAPHDGEEWIDAVILALDGAWRCGLTPQQIVDGIVAKQAKNERRTWPDWRTADPTKAIEHDRASEQPAAVDGMADFEIHAGGEYFASVFGQREQAWKEAMHYVSQMSPEDGEPEVYEVTRRKVVLASQPGGSGNDR